MILAYQLLTSIMSSIYAVLESAGFSGLSDFYVSSLGNLVFKHWEVKEYHSLLFFGTEETVSVDSAIADLQLRRYIDIALNPSNSIVDQIETELLQSGLLAIAYTRNEYTRSDEFTKYLYKRTEDSNMSTLEFIQRSGFSSYRDFVFEVRKDLNFRTWTVQEISKSGWNIYKHGNDHQFHSAISDFEFIRYLDIKLGLDLTPVLNVWREFVRTDLTTLSLRQKMR